MKVTITNTKNEKLNLIENFTLYLPWDKDTRSYNLTLEDEGYFFRVKAKDWYSGGGSDVDFIKDDLAMISFCVEKGTVKGFTVNRGGFTYQLIAEKLSYSYKLNVLKWGKTND